jgi:hypothetical protein
MNGSNSARRERFNQSLWDRLALVRFHSNFAMNKKALKTIGMLLFGFYTCWTPILSYFVCSSSDSFDELTIYILMLIVSCNSVINPCVHAIRHRRILIPGRSLSSSMPSAGAI